MVQLFSKMENFFQKQITRRAFLKQMTSCYIQLAGGSAAVPPCEARREKARGSGRRAAMACYIQRARNRNGMLHSVSEDPGIAYLLFQNTGQKSGWRTIFFENTQIQTTQHIQLLSWRCSSIYLAHVLSCSSLATSRTFWSQIERGTLISNSYIISD